MAMTGEGLGLALIAAVNALTDADKLSQTKVITAIGNGIVTYLKTNAVVNVTSVSGVTTGPGVSGPGLGTLT